MISTILEILTLTALPHPYWPLIARRRGSLSSNQRCQQGIVINYEKFFNALLRDKNLFRGVEKHNLEEAIKFSDWMQI